jgi:biotin transport system substrate-specific component
LQLQDWRVTSGCNGHGYVHSNRPKRRTQQKKPISNPSLKGKPVNREISTPNVYSARQISVPAGLRFAGIVLGGSIFLAVCAHISIPLWFTPVPLTLQPFGVLLLGLLLSPRLAGTTLLAYLAEGAAGLPVFAPGSGLGIAHLLGPTGGYLMAYPVAACLIAVLWQRSTHSLTWALLSSALGDLMILAGGALWLAARTHLSLGSALALAIGPFLPGEALKISASAGIATGWRRIHR